jgi:hypothetical protein
MSESEEGDAAKQLSYIAAAAAAAAAAGDSFSSSIIALRDGSTFLKSSPRPFFLLFFLSLRPNLPYSHLSN